MGTKMERTFITDMKEGIELLEALTTKLGTAVDQINAGVDDINHGRGLFARLAGAMTVEQCLREAQKACRDFDARLEKLRSERDEA